MGNKNQSKIDIYYVHIVYSGGSSNGELLVKYLVQALLSFYSIKFVIFILRYLFLHSLFSSFLFNLINVSRYIMSNKSTGSVKWFNESKGFDLSPLITAVLTYLFTSNQLLVKASKHYLKAKRFLLLLNKVTKALKRIMLR